MSRRARMLKALAATAIAAFAGGCSGNTDTERLGQLIIQSFSSGGIAPVTRDEAAAIPYANMGLRLGDSAEALLVLGTQTPQQLDWYAGDTVLVATRDGRVIRTVGLPYDLGGLQVRESAIDGSAILLSADFPDLGVYGIIIRCQAEDAGPDTIEIFGTGIATRHMVEHCADETLGWHYDNEFWKDAATGYIWRSIQHIHPQSDPLTLQVFRPEDMPQ